MGKHHVYVYTCFFMYSVHYDDAINSVIYIVGYCIFG